MKFKKLIAGVIALSLLFCINPVQAAEKNYTETKEYTSTDRNKTYDFPEEIEKDGKIYRITDKVKYTVINSSKLTEKKTITETRTFNGLAEQKVDETVPSEEYGDLSLKLVDVQYTPVNIESLAETISLNASTDFGYLIAEPKADAAKEVQYSDNGETKTALAQLQSVRAVSEPTWQSGYVITGRYIGSDVASYQFNDIQIPKTNDGTVPYQGYENAILASLGLDSSIVRINSASWSDDGYENGQYVRYASFNCSVLTTRYFAEYSAELPATETVYEAAAAYSTEADIPTGEKEYEIRAVAEYEQVTNYTPIIIAAGTILILVVLAVALLFYLRRKRRVSE